MGGRDGGPLTRVGCGGRRRCCRGGAVGGKNRRGAVCCTGRMTAARTRTEDQGEPGEDKMVEATGVGGGVRRRWRRRRLHRCWGMVIGEACHTADIVVAAGEW
jgi:hypothetical protein